MAPTDMTGIYLGAYYVEALDRGSLMSHLERTHLEGAGAVKLKTFPLRYTPKIRMKNKGGGGK